jgi:glycosyltransferase involved in cell wall biosynthesis
MPVDEALPPSSAAVPAREPTGRNGFNTQRSPRHLLLISYEYPPLGGGLGRAVRRTALEFVRLGHEVTILTSRFGPQAAEERDGPLTVLRIPVMRRHQHHASVLDVLSFAVSGLVSGRRRLGNRVPGAILAYLTVPSGIVGAWLSLRTGAPLMTLLRGTDVPGHRELSPWMHRLAWPVTQWVWRRSAHVVSNSWSMAAAAERAMPGLRVEAVWNGVDADRFTPGAEESPRTGPPVVLYAGRLVKVKRLDLLLHAWGRARARLAPDATLELAGYGPERQPLEALARNLGLGDSVRFLGQLSEDALLQAYRRATIFVSISLAEGLPNSVLEALACGVPALLSDIGPHREILDGTPGGLLCPSGEAEGIALALVELIQSVKSERVIPNAARSAVLGRFDWQRTAEALLGLLDRGHAGRTEPS